MDWFKSLFQYISQEETDNTNANASSISDEREDGQNSEDISNSSPKIDKMPSNVSIQWVEKDTNSNVNKNNNNNNNMEVDIKEDHSSKFVASANSKLHKDSFQVCCFKQKANTHF